MSRPPLKLITWEDSYNGNHSWLDLDTLSEEVDPMIITTVGFELQRTDERVVLAMSYGDSRAGLSPTVCDLFTIPVCCIRSERVLR